MTFRHTLSTLLTICLVSSVSGNWKEATDEEGHIRIPMQNPRGHSWFAALRMGTPLQGAQFCAIDNNHALSVVFGKDCDNCVSDRPNVYDSKNSETYMRQSNKAQVVHDDGFAVSGYMSADSMCFGMFGNREQFENPETTVCMNNQFFLLADSQIDYDWSSKATNDKHIDSICGLGKEKSSMTAKGWLARAAHNGDLKNLVYSLTLVPQSLHEPIAGSPTLP